MKIVRRLGQFVQKIATDLRVADQRFVDDCIRGMAKVRSTMLTEIGRALHEGIALIKTVTRLSRMASSKHFDDERLRANFVAEVAPLSKRELPFAAVDLTEVAKPYAKEMEGLCLVRDASSRRERETDDRKPRGKPQARGRRKSAAENPKRSKDVRRKRPKKAEIVPGYWVFEVVLTALEKHIIVPLLTEVFSTETPDFKSQNDVIEHWLEYLAPSMSPGTIWLFDRGFDGGYILGVLHRLELRWVVRMVGSRNVEFQEESKRMKLLAAGLNLPHSTVVSTRGRGSKDRQHSVRFGFIPVHIKDLPDQRGLIVADMGRSRSRIMLLCWKLPASAKEAGMLIRAYLRRWGAEDSARAVKQLCGAEAVRVQSLRAVARLVRLAAMALAWLCLLLLLAPATAARIMARAKTVGKEPLLLVYRMAEGIRPLR